MKFVMPDDGRPNRVITAKSMRATRRGKRGMILFISIAILLILGVAWKLWPIVNIYVELNIETLTAQLDVNVDLDITEVSLATLTIPGRYLSIGEDRNLLTNDNYLIREIDDRTIVFSKEDLKLLVEQSFRKLLPEEAVLLPQTMSIDEGHWQATGSRMLYRGNVKVHIDYYFNPPIDNWRQEIRGMDIAKASEILSTKTGVEKINIIIYPSFFAKISQKIPKDTSAIRFSLDTN